SRHGLVLAGTLLLLSSCTVPEVSLEGKECDSTHPCVSGMSCVEGLCRPEGAATGDDAGSGSDAAIATSDGGTADGGGAVATRLAFSVQPSPGVAGKPITPA